MLLRDIGPLGHSSLQNQHLGGDEKWIVEVGESTSTRPITTQYLADGAGESPRGPFVHDGEICLHEVSLGGTLGGV